MRSGSVVLAFLFFASSAILADQPRLEIDPRDKRTEIRAELLKYTPLGSSSQEVLTFINKRLATADAPTPQPKNHGATGASAGHSDKKGVKVIKLDLGDYLPNPGLLLLPIPLPLKDSLYVQWAFDSDDKLIEIFLDRVPKDRR